MEEFKQVVIDGFKVDDLEQVARVLADAFEDEWRRILRIPREDVPGFLVEVKAIETTPFPGYFVARDQGRAVGVMGLKWRGQKRPRLDLQLRKAATYGGWMTAFKLWLAYRTEDYNPEEGECYVDELAVEAGARRRGIGTKLLKYGRQFALDRCFKKYTLHVAGNNDIAREVYRKAGFELLRRERSLIQGWLAGVKEWLYLGQDLCA
jgi:ribosomal protein S18 acetylase RimI-like enzyme